MRLLHGICSTILLASQVDAAALKVLPTEPNIIREINSNLILTCSGAADIEWVGPDGFIISAASRDESSVYIQKVGSRVRLRITDLDPETTGDYTCRSPDGGEDSYETRSVNIRTTVDFGETPDIQRFLQGDTAQVVCDVESNGLSMTTEWYIPTDLDQSKPMKATNGHNFEITSIQPEMNGTFICSVGTDDTGDVFEKEILVIVESPPTIAYFPANDYILTVGEEFNLDCVAFGNPSPKVVWNRKTSDGDVTFRNSEKLTFESIHVENSGDYECVAENTRDTVRSGIKIVVLPPPTIFYENVELSADSALEITLGQTFSLDCQSMMVPNSDFVWSMPDGSQLAKSKFTRVAETTDTGDYRCTSTIIRGADTIETSSVINVQIQYSAIIIADELNVYSYPSMVTNIECNFDANPVGVTTLTAKGNEQSFDANTGLLQIKATEDDFPSSFTCLNTNKVGSNKYTIQLKKAVLPNELRNIKVIRAGIIDAEIEWSRDYSPGQIDLQELIVTVEARQRPVKVVRYALTSQSRLKLVELEPETVYKISIQGKNIVGQSPVSKQLTFQTKKLDTPTPTVEIVKIATKNGEYFVNWRIVQNGGGKLRKLSLEYGLYDKTTGEMKRMKHETHLPSTSEGELKLDSSQLEINERYWVMLTAHNEQLSSRVAKVDFQPLDPAENRILILSICVGIGLLLVLVAVDITCYFTNKKGMLNTIINRQIPEGAQQISESSENSSTDEEGQREKCLPNTQAINDETDGGLCNMATECDSTECDVESEKKP